MLASHFRASECTKYALEVLRLQIQLKVLSPNLSHQIKWHRFVNTRGGLGMNIPCDLYNEHVNKLIKLIIQNMGSNLQISPPSPVLIQPSQTYKILGKLCRWFCKDH